MRPILKNLKCKEASTKAKYFIHARNIEVHYGSQRQVSQILARKIVILDVHTRLWRISIEMQSLLKPTLKLMNEGVLFIMCEQRCNSKECLLSIEMMMIWLLMYLQDPISCFSSRCSYLIGSANVNTILPRIQVQHLYIKVILCIYVAEAKLHALKL